MSSPVAAKLDQLALPEVSVGKLRVREREAIRIYHVIAELHDVEIDRARSPLLASLAAQLPLDTQQIVEERLRSQRRLQRDHLVEIVALLLRPDGSRFLHDRFGQE